MDALTLRENDTSIPTIHVISDSMGATAQAIARAAASQFGEADPNIELLSNVRNFQMVEKFLLEQLETHEMVFGDPRIVVFYTIIDDDITSRLHDFLVEHPMIYAVDLLTKAVDAIAQVSGMVPMDVPGEQHIVNERYFHRIEAMEWTIAHDDGRNPQDLPKSDIVLLGVSRCGKTPTSIYLAQEGYRVSNVPLDPQSAPPKEIFQVDTTRLFGLMTTVDVLRPIRKRRLGNAIGVASDYADPEKIEEDLEKSRALMRKLGCIVVHTENRAVEETAQQILRYYEMAHPRKASSGRRG